MNKRYQIYHQTTITTNAAAYVTCPRRGKIRSVSWIVGIDSVTDNSDLTCELSFASVCQATVNDAIGIISGCAFRVNLGAAGADHGSINFQDTMEIPVLPGDRLNYNVTVAGTVAANVRILIEIDEN